MAMGIYGSLGHFNEQDLHLVRSMLRHRGTNDYIVSRGPNIRLAYRSTRAECAVDANDDVPLVYAGLITNVPELAAAVGSDRDDTSEPTIRQVLWALYCRFGIGAFERINGTFAIALADTESQSLLLAVDRWAARPLCFAKLERGWLFASEAKALFAAMDAPPHLDLGVLAHVAATKYLPLHKTLAREVQTVGPGEYVRIHLEASHASTYSPLRVHVDRGTSETACIARLERCLLEAARRLIGSQSRIGIGLSGGLDSTLTLGAVRAVAPTAEVFTYTAAFHCDEPVLAQAREAARHFATHHCEIVIAPEELPDLLPELLWCMEDPVAREEMIVYHVLAQRAAREVPIVLYGHMADLLFGGMPRHLLIKMAADWRVVRGSMLEFYDFTQSGKRPRSVVGRLLVAAYLRGNPIQAPSPLGEFEIAPGKHASADGPEALNEVLLHSLACPSEIGAIERIHAWAGVEFASLFHDRDVANCAFSIPSNMKIRGQVRKHVLRAAARKFLPDAFARRPKDLIRIRRDAPLSPVLAQLRDDLLPSSCVRARGLFNPEYVDEIFSRAAKPGCTDAVFYHLWTLLLIELWCRAFGDVGARARVDRLSRSESLTSSDSGVSGIGEEPLPNSAGRASALAASALASGSAAIP